MLILGPIIGITFLLIARRSSGFVKSAMAIMGITTIAISTIPLGCSLVKGDYYWLAVIGYALSLSGLGFLYMKLAKAETALVILTSIVFCIIPFVVFSNKYVST